MKRFTFTLALLSCIVCTINANVSTDSICVDTPVAISDSIAIPEQVQIDTTAVENNIMTIAEEVIPEVVDSCTVAKEA